MFNRMLEQFERKFDGFPASVDDGAMPAVTEQTHTDYIGGDLLIDDYFATEKPQCPDVEVPTDPNVDVSGNTVTEALTFFSAEAHGSREYAASLPVKYFVSVWLDGLVLVLNEDYTVTDDKHVTIGEVSAGAVITARYVVA
jgi:hypothetical protein